MWTPPRGASWDARIILCGKDSNRGTGKRNLWKLETEFEATSRMPTEWKGPSRPFHLSQQSKALATPDQGRCESNVPKRDRVFLCRTSKPAHLARLLVMDVEQNPEPYECGVYQKRVSGCSIKCTWCMKWIHQVCSEMTRGQIRQIAWNERYAFECRQCRKPSKTTRTIASRKPDETVPWAPRSQIEQIDLTESAGENEDNRHKETRRRKKIQYERTEPQTPKKQGE